MFFPHGNSLLSPSVAYTVFLELRQVLTVNYLSSPEQRLLTVKAADPFSVSYQRKSHSTDLNLLSLLLIKYNTPSKN